MSRPFDPRFDAWRSKATETDILLAAQMIGAKLKRAGRDWNGPCPVCGGRDGFVVTPAKRVFLCRKAGIGGSVINMVMHATGGSFLHACEILTGEPPPGSQSTPLTEEEKAAIAKRRREADERARAREAAEEARRRRRKMRASVIWGETTPLTGTPGETYLVKRGLRIPPSGWPPVVRFHPKVEWELGAVYDADGNFVSPGPSYPAIIARCDATDGEMCGVWRIFLDPEGRGKAPVENPKLGLGSGGAVRIGGGEKHIGAAEGLETSLALWEMSGYGLPVWAMLSTSGMIAFRPPAFVRRVAIYPDGDRPRLNPKTGEVEIGQGMKAASKMLANMVEAGIDSELMDPPDLDWFDASQQDFLDVNRWGLPACYRDNFTNDFWPPR